MSATGLRFDKVALRVAARLRADLDWLVPDGSTLVITVTAPVRSWALTADIVAQLVAAHLPLDELVLGNHVRARLVEGPPGGVRVLVHNPGPTLEELVEHAIRKAGSEPPGRKDARVGK